MITTIPYLQALMYYRISGLLSLFVPRRVLENRQRHVQLSMAKLLRRLEKGVNTDRGDFLSHVLKEPEGKVMSREELQTLSQILIVGGSETTATTLSSATYYLTTNLPVYQKLVEEIRSRFTSEQEISLTTVGELKYLSAVIEEALRMFPPVPVSLPRIVPRPGEVIDGRFVPAGVSCFYHHYFSCQYQIPLIYLLNTCSLFTINTGL